MNDTNYTATEELSLLAMYLNGQGIYQIFVFLGTGSWPGF